MLNGVQHDLPSFVSICTWHSIFVIDTTGVVERYLPLTSHEATTSEEHNNNVYSTLSGTAMVWNKGNRIFLPIYMYFYVLMNNAFPKAMSYLL